MSVKNIVAGLRNPGMTSVDIIYKRTKFKISFKVLLPSLGA